MKLLYNSAALWLLGALVPVLAQGAVNPVLTDTHTLRVGGYSQESDITISSTRDGGQEQELDLGELGLDEEHFAFTASYQWRFGERWSMELSWFSFQSDGSRTIEETFTFDGEEFRAGAKLALDFSVDSLLLDAFYSVYKSDNAELRIGGGLHAFNFSADLAASAEIGDIGASGTVADEELLAPLPNLRIDGLYAFSPRWSLYAGVGWLSANYGDFEGGYLFANTRLAFRVTDGFSLAIGYQVVDTDVTYNASRREVAFKSEYYGPTAYLSYSF